MKRILLTFDVEEADILREHNILDIEKEFELSEEGLLGVSDLLKEHNIRSTFFTTANFAKRFSKEIKDLSKEGHEIACHGYSHSDSYLKDFSKIQLAKKEIEKIIGKKIKGFRAPRFEIKNISRLSDFGFSYDSSVHPTWIPGRYMNLSQKRRVYKIGNMIEIPISVSPFFRLPMSWIFFKNLPLSYSKIITKLNSDYVLIFFHPWEFADLNKIKIPKYIKRKSGNELLKMLEKYILFTKRRTYSFDSVGGYLQRRMI